MAGAAPVSAAALPRQEDVLGLLDTIDQSVANMLPQPNETSAEGRVQDASRSFAGAVKQLESFLLQLQQVRPAPHGPLAAQEQEVADLQSELEEKERLIAHARAQISHWQDTIGQQEQLQENTLFAGLGS
ncbi:hypothetical protein HYH03_014424 [Edaphochlamys debaryana]|uniref:Mediator of RNA polymerase II transcription subunit 28 n=1 Tax=Edaphochlamys debaryana TaxID=47281 RepID=A0A836BS65_9CHLO|nr:hypothetical protein HYH03_014424 [Edaphochlamys debaryana]|eukprot:KAG2486925.1 hypothetical protein HYH03_014424 [Edaphochlamys debaryana]